jgi:TetR/AcrR family transcriptional regulator
MGKEQDIKSTAMRIFFAEGRFDARIHEIADAAGVNKALVHYYFRNREKLLAVVFAEAMEASFLKMFSILLSEAPFEKKVKDAVRHISSYMSEYPFIESFIISQINARPGEAGQLIPIREAKAFTKKFLPEVRAYLKKRKIMGVDAPQFIVNMMALCAYPSSTRPVIMNILGLGEKSYRLFLAARQKSLLNLILMRY